LLASQWDPQGWELVSDTGLHTVVPIGFTLYWFVASPKEALSARVLRAVMVYPTAYTVYVMARGEVLGRYPYFFIDVPTIGYVAAMRNVVGILILLLAVASGLSVLARRVSVEPHRVNG
ncbi:MAG: Pr6Pr family membrane protein, partial [Gemmatimonadaceae bacterium]